jgi:hypothetical protein
MLLKERLTPITTPESFPNDGMFVWQVADDVEAAAVLAANNAESAAEVAVKVAGATLAAGAAARQAALAYDAVRQCHAAMSDLREAINGAATIGESVAVGALLPALQSAGDRAADRADSCASAAVVAQEAARTLRQCAATSGPRYGVYDR